jgi:hypothetical protein
MVTRLLERSQVRSPLLELQELLRPLPALLLEPHLQLLPLVRFSQQASLLRASSKW